MTVNKVILIGNLGKDPELRYTANQHFPVCSFSLATHERRKDQSGNWSDQTEWHNVVVWGKTAENCSSYLKKGRQVYIEGRLQTRKWQDRDGKDRWTTEVVANTVQFLGAKGEGGGRAMEAGPTGFSSEESGPSVAESPGSPEAGEPGGDVGFDDDDVPF